MSRKIRRHWNVSAAKHVPLLPSSTRTSAQSTRSASRTAVLASHSLMLFDFATQKWAEIAKISLGFANWSKNGDYVYFLHGENEPSVMRIDIRDWKLERVADLKNFRQTGYWKFWL